MNGETSQVQKKDRDFRNIMLTIVGVAVILSAVAGGTFAYYAFSVSNVGTVAGSAASTAGIAMSVTKVAPTKTSSTNVLVPQLSTTLNKAIIGTSNNKCIDGNNNTVCLIYRVDISNTTSNVFGYTLKLQFAIPSGSKFTNLKYAFLPASSFSATSATSVITSTPVSATTANQDIITSQTANYTATSSVVSTQYFVVWLNETSSEQKSTDYGTFTGTVTMTDNAGNTYLTSTFTS